MDLIPIEYRGERILLTEQLAQIYETEVKNISNNFNRNPEKFVEGKHYYKLEGEDLRIFKGIHQNGESLKFVSKLYLWTKRGASRHCKMLGTDKAWEQFDVLEENYFNPGLKFQIPQTYSEALRLAAEQAEELEKKNLLLAQKNQQINELQPKATYYDLILRNKSLLSITKIAKDYGLSGKKMNVLLHDMGVQYKQGDVWLLYQKYADKGYTQSKTHVIDDEINKFHTYWTQKGRLFIYDLLKQRGILPLIEREKAAS